MLWESCIAWGLDELEEPQHVTGGMGEHVTMGSLGGCVCLFVLHSIAFGGKG